MCFEKNPCEIVHYNLEITCFVLPLHSSVELNRSAFLEPESLPKPKKTLFVGQKLTLPIGEIVSGGPLQHMTPHVPLCSFNGQNKYTGENSVVDSASNLQKVSVDIIGKKLQS